MYTIWNQLQWHEHSVKNSLPLSSINPPHLNSRTNMCLQNYENISLNHFVNLSLGLNCTWLNYRIHVAPTAYRTFFVTTIFEITGCTPQLYMCICTPCTPQSNLVLFTSVHILPLEHYFNFFLKMHNDIFLCKSCMSSAFHSHVFLLLTNIAICQSYL